MSSLRVIKSTFKLHMSQSFGRATFRFCIIFQPIIYTFILYMMYKDSAHNNYLNYVVLGSGLCSLWSAICFSSAGDIERERGMGTLQNICACPSKFTTIVFGKVLANTFLGLLGMALSLTFTMIFFNQFLAVKDVPLFIFCFILMLISFIAISLVIAPIFTLSKNARALMNCLEYPMFILCGFIFPIDVLPSFIRPLSYILSPTLAIKLLRESANGVSDFNIFYKEVIVLCLICLIYFIVSKILFSKIDKKTRIDATLGVS